MGNLEACLDQLKKHPEVFAAAIQGLGDAQLSKRPNKDSWAAKEIICHMRDVEDYFFERFQSILAMDEPRLPAANPERWAADRQYLRNNVNEALATFRERREETLQFLRRLTPAQWNRAGVHVRYGRLTIQAFLERMANHDQNHLDQLNRALAGQP